MVVRQMAVKVHKSQLDEIEEEEEKKKKRKKNIK
jgi:hypothetical protein